ncbi:MAG: Thermostable carboxypeptidase 1 [uncultured Truepera sp.]|uniref:Metal-dependent carboxypeptidase n=1 Tax=uncultured Truepera sp. TaxID=543023 RepID=A0A6J4VLV7_9DEIN|nr:MAG: Thermostable carboxypeptidase 1 [uncultured Truepera sp.]
MKDLDAFRRWLAGINDLMNAMSVLNWDARVTMPPGGGETRARQLGTLAEVIRERFSSDTTHRLLDAAEKEVATLPDDAYKVRELRQAREALGVLARVPPELSAELVRLGSVAQPIWAEAKANKDFVRFAPSLEKMVSLTRELAEAIGYDAHPYDALLKQYEPGMTAAGLNTLFTELRGSLLPLLKRIQGSPARAPTHIFDQTFPKALQRAFALNIAEQFGFDPNRGRVDESHHPFEISFTRNDVRMTTRYNERYLPGAIFGLFHETGHALYEQNVDPSLTRTVLATDLLGMYAVGGTSFGLHESQSRLWENMVGRSLTFWQNHFGALQATFPDQLSGVDAETFYHAVNDVKPSLIRVEADEVTYNLHIMLRTELELGLMDGTIAVRELPEVWNAKMQDYLGLTPPDDSAGVLQDIHWSHGHIGTFPTYTLGNVMAAQFLEAAKAQVPGLTASLKAADYAPLREWLTENLYRHGRAYTAAELLRRSTGGTLDAGPFTSYLNDKYEALYPER